MVWERMERLEKIAGLPGNILGVPEVHRHIFKGRLVRVVVNFSPFTCCSNVG